MIIKITILEDNDQHYTMLLNALEHWGQSTGHQLNIERFDSPDKILMDEIIESTNLIFADIKLDSQQCTNGIEICKSLRLRDYEGEIIILTAYQEFVFEGYDVLAMNYLLKPFTSEDIFECMNRYVSLHTSEYYYYRSAGKIIQIPFKDIVSISQVKHDCFIQTPYESYREILSLSSLQKQLPVFFVQCHRSCIVNINHVTSLKGNIITLSTRKTQKVGRTYLILLRKSLIELAERQ